MRVLFTVSDWPGHWFALVPVGWALQSAGHEVRVLCAPSQTEPLTRAGLTPVPLLDGWDMGLQARLQNYLDARDGQWPFPGLPPHPLTGEPLDSLAGFDLDGWFAGFRPELTEAARRSTDAAVAFARAWRPELVLHDQLSLEGPLVGAVLQVPSVLQLWGPMGPDDAQPGLIPLPLDFSAAFERNGLRPLAASDYRHVLDPCPEAVAPPLRSAERLPVRYLPYNGPGPAPERLPAADGRPRVCVVWGTSVTAMFGEVSFAVPKVVSALTALDAEVVLTVTGPDRARITELPPGVTLLEQAPLHLLLPGCDLVVHHGGAGCSMTSIDAGLPQLVLPNGLDQHLNAGRLVAAGVALSRPNAASDAEAIRTAAAELLADPAYRERAEALRAASHARPAPAELVPTLIALAESARATRPADAPLPS